MTTTKPRGKTRDGGGLAVAGFRKRSAGVERADRTAAQKAIVFAQRIRGRMRGGTCDAHDAFCPHCGHYMEWTTGKRHTRPKFECQAKDGGCGFTTEDVEEVGTWQECGHDACVTGYIGGAFRVPKTVRLCIDCASFYEQHHLWWHKVEGGHLRRMIRDFKLIPLRVA